MQIFTAPQDNCFVLASFNFATFLPIETNILKLHKVNEDISGNKAARMKQEAVFYIFNSDQQICVPCAFFLVETASHGSLS